nr:putative ribonuclease H-like domain-containing protein [Tanacetum cinerariifolium]
MIGNISYLFDFEEINERYVAFGGNPKGSKIKGKGKIKTGKLDFDDIYFVKELKFNLFSISQMCDKKKSVLFIDNECVVLSSDFKFPDENHVLLRVPRENNMYNVDLKNIVPSGDLTCLFAKATLDENPKGGKITSKGKIKTSKLDFDDVYFVQELKFNLFSVSQICDKKNNVLFTDTECVVLSSDFKLPDENYVLLRVPRENNMYNVDLNNIVPSEDLTCLFAKATLDESNLWHRRLGHINFKIMNKLVKGNLFRGLPSKVFENNDTCVACKKGKQHRASCKAKPAEAVNTACYVQNRVLVTKPHNKTPYELLLGRTPSIGFIRPFGCHVTILNTLDPIGNKPNHNAGIQENFDADPQNTDAAFDEKKNDSAVHVSPSSSDKSKKHDEMAKREAKGKSLVDLSTGVRDLSNEFEEFFVNNTNRVNAASAPITAVGPNSTNSTNSFNAAGPSDNDGHTQEEGIDYEEVFAPVARIESIQLFLAYASFMGFIGYQMDVKSAFPYGTIKEEVYVCQPPGFEDPDYPDKVCVDDIIFGSINKELCKYFEKLMKDKFQMSLMGELTFFLGLQEKQKDNRIFIGQDKYVAKILRKFGLTDVKRIFRYLKGKPHLGFWYLKDSPFNLVAYSDSDYAGASLDRKSTIGGCQFLGFDQIVDFLNAHTIQYALMVYPIIYVLCIKQFWAFVSIKKYNDAVKLQALIDRKKYMSAKRTAWNEFSSFIASVVICLATEQDKIAQALEITKLKQRVRKLEKKIKVKSSGLKRLKKVGTAQRVESSIDTVVDDQEDASKQGEN